MEFKRLREAEPGRDRASTLNLQEPVEGYSRNLQAMHT